MLIKYVRDNKRRPIGVVVAVGATKVGWSKCHRADDWDKKMGLKIAIGRAYHPKDIPAPYCMRPEVDQMEQRSLAYFK